MTVNTLGTDSGLEGDPFARDSSRASRTVAELLWPFCAGCLALFTISALFYYHFNQQTIAPQSVLQHSVAFVYRAIGLAPAALFCLLVAVWSTIWFVTGTLHRPGVRLCRLVVMAIMLGVFLNLGDGGVAPALHKGEIGAWLAGRLVAAIGYVPSLILVWTTTFAALLLATDFFFSESFERMRRPAMLASRRWANESGVEAAVTEHLRGLSQPADRPLVVPFAGGPAAAATSSGAQVTSFSAAMPAADEGALSPTDEVGLGDSDEEQVADRSAPDAPALQSGRMSYQERRAARRRAFEAAAEPVAADDEPVEAADPGARPDEKLTDEHGSIAAEELVSLFGDGELWGGGPSGDGPSGEREEGNAEKGHELAASEAHADDEALASDQPDDEASDDEPAADEPAADELSFGEGVRAAVAIDPDVANDEDVVGHLAGPVELEARTDAVVAVDDDAIAPDHASADLDVEAGDAEDAEADDSAIDHGAGEPERVVAEAAVAGGEQDESGDDFEGPAADELATERWQDDEDDEPPLQVVPIPRPETRPATALPTPPMVRGASAEPERGGRQQKLFRPEIDEDLVREAIDVVTGARRATAALLQRKLRVDYEFACELLAELGARGVVAFDGDATQGRVIDR